MMDMDRISRDIKQEEGLRLKPYKCPAGAWTIGYGHMIGKPSYFPDGIDLQMAEYLFEHDLEDAVHNARIFVGEESFWGLTDARQHCLVCMALNMGLPRLSKFGELRKAIIAQDWEWAGREILDSKYARQLPYRAKRNWRRMVTGEESNP